MTSRVRLAFTPLAVCLLATPNLQPQSPAGLFAASDTLISIVPVDGNSWRYRVFQTGESALLTSCGISTWCAGPEFSTAKPVRVRMALRAAPADSVAEWRVGDTVRQLRRRVLRTAPAAIQRGDIALKGLLLLPPGPGPHPAVVFVHGSGRQSAVATAYSPHFIAANGVAVLVFDKRGTGNSGGDFTMDFSVLADDVSAGVNWLKTQTGIDSTHLGLVGYSQGGWVAPLAASRNTAVRFVVVSYGMIDSPFEEERIQTLQRLRDRGLTDVELAEADTLTRAAIHVVASRFKTGWDSLEAVDRRFRNRRWRTFLGGTTPGELLRYPRFIVKLLGPRRAPPGLSWYYDSRAVLQSLAIPMAWLIGADDRSAPNEFTLAELRRLRAAGKPYTAVVFPGADHGIIEYRVENGERKPTRHAPTYFATEVDFIRRFAGLR